EAAADVLHFVHGDAEVLAELRVELLEHVAPVAPVLLDLVELPLELARVLRVDDVVEVRDEAPVDLAAEPRGLELARLEPGVFARAELAEDFRIRRRTPDSVLLERLDERRFRVAGRGLREL